MITYKRIFLFLVIFNLISCGRNKENEEHELEQQKEPNYEQQNTTTHELQKKDTIYETPEDSIKAVKNSILRKQKFKRKEQTETTDNSIEIPETSTTPVPTTTAKKV